MFMVLLVEVAWLFNSVSPIRISPHEDEESLDDNDEAVEDDADVTPEAFEQNNAVEAEDDKGDPVVNEDDKLVAW